MTASRPYDKVGITIQNANRYKKTPLITRTLNHQMMGHKHKGRWQTLNRQRRFPDAEFLMSLCAIFAWICCIRYVGLRMLVKL